MELNNRTMKDIPSHVEPFGFDRSKVTPGIMHFGVGQFCRGHLMLFVRDILRLSAKEGGRYNDWGVVGVNVPAGPREKQMEVDFKKQDCLYTFTTLSTEGEAKHYLMGSMLDYMYAPEEQAKVLRMLKDPRIKIISLTITEGGYNIDEKKGVFDLKNRDVQHDICNPQAPKTVFGYIVEGLRRRREAGVPPFTIMSCDNLRHNGEVAKKAVLGYAKAVNPELAAWIKANVKFPNSMVDRITPATTPDKREELNKMTGIADREPVVGEDFYQWVIEDKFNNGVRPPWDRVGVTFSTDVPGYENAKVRILNSSHILLSFPALLLGMTYIHEGMCDPDIYRLVNEALEKNVLPTLRVPDGVDIVQYKDKILSRFKNAGIGDQLLRVAGDGCSKVQVFWTENVTAVLRKRMDPSLFAFGIAAYLEMLRGKDEKGNEIPIFEPTLPKGYEKLVRSSDLAAALQLPAFDSWRSMDHAQLDRDVVMFRQIIRKRGVRAAMPWRVKKHKAHM
ncbi:polyol:NADP oxidoreductase [Trypanosoma theileri]|uniref:mannitol 2-dehydrogenase n=1 Tax=Trypanosoma theileri TaxID=67003 RepID=A0A1X0NP65_9TRYP|nr:polyol:NADP oxidoreductase [Trypanosoma theileri]ORC86283.1 polyol:NADP oxidoreductase [Trypanosoma theileri]